MRKTLGIFVAVSIGLMLLLVACCPEYKKQKSTSIIQPVDSNATKNQLLDIIKIQDKKIAQLKKIHAKYKLLVNTQELIIWQLRDSLSVFKTNN